MTNYVCRCSEEQCYKRHPRCSRCEQRVCPRLLKTCGKCEAPHHNKCLKRAVRQRDCKTCTARSQAAWKEEERRRHNRRVIEKKRALANDLGTTFDKLVASRERSGEDVLKFMRFARECEEKCDQFDKQLW